MSNNSSNTVRELSTAEFDQVSGGIKVNGKPISSPCTVIVDVSWTGIVTQWTICPGQPPVAKQL